MKGFGSTAWQTERVAVELGRMARGFVGLDPTASPLSVTLYPNYVEVEYHGVRTGSGLDVKVVARVGTGTAVMGGLGVVYGRGDYDDESGLYEWTYGPTINEKGEVS